MEERGNKFRKEENWNILNNMQMIVSILCFKGYFVITIQEIFIIKKEIDSML
jgi:hypothetical protein